jgi:addiction module HigA family antidote
MEPHVAAHTLPPFETVPSRRVATVHPGPAIQRDYLTPIGFGAADLAPQIGMDAGRLERMLAGTEPIDIESAIRLARALQINPRIIVERQARHDFTRLRENREIETVPVLRNDGRVTFPETGYIHGRLVGLRENSPYGGVRDETLGFFPDDSPGHPPLHIYSLEVGAKLRVYDPASEVSYVGVVMRTLEGRPLLPFVRPTDWIVWFAERYRADYVEPAHSQNAASNREVISKSTTP